MPICTLPMLHGKIYVINSPSLIAAAMKSKTLSFDPVTLDFMVGALGLPRKLVNKFAAPGVMDDVHHAIKANLSGALVSPMNTRALGSISFALNSVPTSGLFRIADSYAWLRSLMTSATFDALYGSRNPLNDEDATHMA